MLLGYQADFRVSEHLGMGETTKVEFGGIAGAEAYGGALTIDLTGPEPSVRLSSETILLDSSPPNKRSRFLVRSFDLVTALVLLVAVVPFMLVIAAAISLSSSGPIIYKSKRISQTGGEFHALKFRTMITNADHALIDLRHRDPLIDAEYRSQHKLKDDPRVTRTGRALRRTNLDELPQLVNILKGEMSLVGPRPKLPSEADHYGGTLKTVLRVRPGLTGLWQTSGRNDLTMDQRVILDVRYATTRSAWMDAKILAKTAAQMLSPRKNGAY